MPAAEAVDWRREAQELFKAGYGQRETARKLGIPEDRLRKWASRAGIRTSPKPIVTTLPHNLKPVTTVTTACDVIQNDAERLGPEARHTSARIAHKSLLRVEQVVDANPDAGLVLLDSALTAGKLLQTANVPGWERQADRTQGSLVNIAILGVPPDQLRLSECPSVETQ